MTAASLLDGPATMDDEVPSGYHDYTAPRYIVEAEGIENLSWGNDACASFGIPFPIHDEPNPMHVRIWIDHVDPDRRECYAERFRVGVDDLNFLPPGHPAMDAALTAIGHDTPDDMVLMTDDGRQALTFALSLAMKIRPATRALRK